MGEFFDMTLGRAISSRTAHIRLKPTARAKVKEATGCSDEQLDTALEEMGRQMTEIAHSDMRKMSDRTAREHAKNLLSAIAKAKEKKDDPETT